MIKKDVHREGVCTLPVELWSKTKKQHTSKAICLPSDASPQLTGCMDALVEAKVASAMPSSFLHEFTDETAMNPNPYERRVRDLDVKSCFTMDEELRVGRFICADIAVDKIAKISPTSDTTADVRYLRVITSRPSLAAIEKACGKVIHPAEDDTVAFAKNTATKQWTVVPPPPAP